MSLGEVEGITPLGAGAGAGTPTEGMSPAKADDERTHARAIIMRNRFTGFSPPIL